MYDMFWKASAFKQTIPEEWKNKGDLWGLTSEKQRTADNCGCFVFCFLFFLVCWAINKAKFKWSN